MPSKHILIKNIYYMLSYAFHALRQAPFAYLATEQFDNIHNLLAAILSKGIGQQIKQGLYREYLAQHEALPVLRGKIDLQETMRNIVAQRRVLACYYDDLSEDNPLNQILKSTVSLLLRCPDVATEYKVILKKEMLFFSAVEVVDLSSIVWSNIRFHRNNHTYRMLISLCQLIAEGMLLSTAEGEQRLATFVDEQRMCRLYEKFLLEYYRKEHPLLRATSSQIAWATDDGNRTLLPTMLSDIMLSREDKVLIIDAKYYSRTTQKHYDTLSLRSNNLYQIFTYVKNKAEEGAQSVAGLLLYARTDEERQPNQRYYMSGNRIDVRTLDLNSDFPVIREQLDTIVRDFF